MASQNVFISKPENTQPKLDCVIPMITRTVNAFSRFVSNPGADLALLAGGSQSVVVILSFYLRTRGGRDDTCVVLLTEGLILAGF